MKLFVVRNELFDLFQELFDLRNKIESLEHKVSTNLDENLYTELLTLRNQLKGG